MEIGIRGAKFFGLEMIKGLFCSEHIHSEFNHTSTHTPTEREAVHLRNNPSHPNIRLWVAIQPIVVVIRISARTKAF